MTVLYIQWYVVQCTVDQRVDMLTRTASDDRLMGDHGAAPASPRGTGVVCVMGAGLSASRCAGAGAQVCRGGVCFGLAGPEPRATGAQFCLELRISRRVKFVQLLSSKFGCMSMLLLNCRTFSPRKRNRA